MITDVESIIDLSGSKDFLKLFRVNYNGLRLYIRPEPFNYYSGLTGALSASKFAGDPEVRRLQSWRETYNERHGHGEAVKYVDTTAEFGTLVHEALVRIKEHGKINWNEEKDFADEKFSAHMLKTEGIINMKVLRAMIYDYQKQVGSLLQWVYERVDEIYAIEVPAIWDSLKIATPIDVVCSCRPTPKGDFKMTTVNIKTSAQITKGHMEQAACELMMWNETYPGKEVEVTAIIRTKDWNEAKVPTYDFKYLSQDEAIEVSFAASQRLSLCLGTDATYYPEPSSKAFVGESVLGESPNIEIRSIQEDWADHWSKEQIEKENEL